MIKSRSIHQLGEMGPKQFVSHFRQQLLLPLDYPQRYHGELMYGAPNADVCDWLERYNEWPLHQIYITGPEKSGKTTLTSMIQEKESTFVLSAKALLPPISKLPDKDILIDDAEYTPQEWLFHLINHQFLSHHKLILLSAKAPYEWLFETKDLESRIKAFYVFTIQPMDDTLARQLAFKLLASRSIDYDDSAVDYLLLRINRTYRALFEAIAELDTFLLHKHKRLTLAQVREYLSHNEDLTLTERERSDLPTESSKS